MRKRTESSSLLYARKERRRRKKRNTENFGVLRSFTSGLAVGAQRYSFRFLDSVPSLGITESDYLSYLFFPNFPLSTLFFFSCSFFFFRTYISRARLVKRVRTVSLLSCARIFIPTLFSSLPYFRHTHKRARRAAFLAPKKKEKKRSVVCLVLLSLSLSSPFLTYSKQCHFEPLHTH